MTILTVTPEGQVTLDEEVLKHLGVEPGDEITVDLLPGGRARMRPANAKTTVDDWVGFFGPPTRPAPSIEEINEAIADGWASAMDYEEDRGQPSDERPSFAEVLTGMPYPVEIERDPSPMREIDL